MKWLPEPRVPSCSRQLSACRAGSRPAASASDSSSATRGAAVATTRRLATPAESGMARSIGLAQGPQRPTGEVLGPELGQDGDHAAADVDADRRRDDGARPWG